MFRISVESESWRKNGWKRGKVFHELMEGIVLAPDGRACLAWRWKLHWVTSVESCLYFPWTETNPESGFGLRNILILLSFFLAYETAFLVSARIPVSFLVWKSPSVTQWGSCPVLAKCGVKWTIFNACLTQDKFLFKAKMHPAAPHNCHWMN